LNLFSFSFHNGDKMLVNGKADSNSSPFTNKNAAKIQIYWPNGGSSIPLDMPIELDPLCIADDFQLKEILGCDVHDEPLLTAADKEAFGVTGDSQSFSTKR
jgi:hypothetical protein